MSKLSFDQVKVGRHAATADAGTGQPHHAGTVRRRVERPQRHPHRHRLRAQGRHARRVCARHAVDGPPRPPADAVGRQAPGTRRRAPGHQRPRRRTGTADGGGAEGDGRGSGGGVRGQRDRAGFCRPLHQHGDEQFQEHRHHRQQRRLHLGRRGAEDERRAVVRHPGLPHDRPVPHPARRLPAYQGAGGCRQGCRPRGVPPARAPRGPFSHLTRAGCRTPPCCRSVRC